MEATQVRGSTEDLGATPSYRCSLDPTLLLDDDRRCVDANPAACLFLREPIEAIRRLTLDDLSMPEQRAGLRAAWPLILRGQPAADHVLRDILMPDGTSVAIDLSVTAQIEPGRHLAIIAPSAARPFDRSTVCATPPATKLLTKREREILTLVALGHTGVQIARELFLSPATVQTHVANALIKLSARNRAHCIALALQNNELDLEATLLRR